MRKIYLGDLPGIKKQLCNDIVSAKLKNAFYPVIVAVPGNLVGVYLRRFLARCGGGFCQVRFLTMDDLAAALAEKNLDFISRKAMPPFGQRWLAALTAREAAGGYFGPVAGRPGFCEALTQTFRELEDAGLVRVPLAPGADPGRIAELQRLYAYYRKLSSPFINREATFNAASRAAPPPFMLALYGIYQLSVLEKRLLAVLAAQNGATVYWQEAAAGFASVKPVLRWFEQQGFTVEYTLPFRKSDNNLALLQKKLFQPSPSLDDSISKSADPSLEFICAPDEIGEVEEITREIIGLARAGLRFGEIAVLLPMGSYTRLFQERFTALGIPYYLASGLPLAQTRTGRALLLILKMIGSDYSRRKIMELFSYAPFDYQRVLNSKTPVDPALWDYLTMKAGITRGRRQWQEALKRYRGRLQREIRGKNSEKQKMAEDRPGGQLLQVELLINFLRKFFKEIDHLTASCSWKMLTMAVANILKYFFHPGEEREALLLLLKRLRFLDECAGEFKLKPALELFQSILQTTALPRGKFQQEGVNLLPLSAAAGLSFSVIFIPGLVEKLIPALAQPDPLLPEPERLAFSGILPLRRHKLELEALRFTLALGGTIEKAVLTWPRVSTAASREQLPSFFLSRCGEALCSARPGHDQLSRLPGYRYVAAAPGENIVGGPVDTIEYDLKCTQRLSLPQKLQYYRLLSPALSELLAADLSRFSRRWSSHDGIFTQSVSRNRLSALLGRISVSATALEDYARCPYSYFLKRVLTLTPLEEPEELYSITPLTRGRLLHKILEKFYLRLSEEGLFPMKRYPEKCRSLLIRICREQFSRVPPEERPPYPLIWQLQRRVLEETLQALLEWEIRTAGEFIPQGFEVSFGFSRAVGVPVPLRLASGKTVYFRGRIDRIDRHGSRIRVIDYKTGKRRLKNDSFAGGEALQLPVYLLAADKICKLDERAAADAYAYHLSPDGVKTVIFSGESWARNKLRLKEAVEIIYEGISAGLFFPYPNPGCRYCDYAQICGPDIEKIYRHKADDPVLSSFEKLKKDFV